MKKRNRTCRAQLLLTYFHTGLLSLLKVATANCLRLISQECATDSIKELLSGKVIFTLANLHCAVRGCLHAFLLRNKPLHLDLQVKIIPSLTDT